MLLVELERARDQCVLLPLYAQMDVGDQEQVVGALGNALAAHQPGILAVACHA